MPKVVTVDLNSKDWSKYSTKDLRSFMELFKSPTFIMFKKHITNKMLTRKEELFNYISAGTDEKELSQRILFLKGYVVGLEYINDIENQVAEELDRRSKNKEKKNKM